MILTLEKLKLHGENRSRSELLQHKPLSTRQRRAQGMYTKGPVWPEVSTTGTITLSLKEEVAFPRKKKRRKEQMKYLKK